GGRLRAALRGRVPLPVRLPVNKALPTTCSLVVGALIPMPTLTFGLPKTRALLCVTEALAPIAVLPLTPELTLLLAPTRVLLPPAGLALLKSALKPMKVFATPEAGRNPAPLPKKALEAPVVLACPA